MVRNREAFGAVMPGVAHMRHTWSPDARFTRGQPEKGADLADDLQRCVDLLGPKSIAACFVEPIAGSTGVLVPPEGYLERLRQICDKHGILLVFDEVICGFGRTGKAFAAQSFGVQPDLITMAKALTNGALPMGAVAASEKVYHTITSGALDGAVDSSTATPIPPIRRPAPPASPPSTSSSARGCSSGRRRCLTTSSTACSISRASRR